MDSRITIRPAFGRILTVVVVVIVAAALGSLLLAGGTTALRTAWLPLLLAYTAWLTLWRPHVVIASDGVTLRNVFSTIHVPWPAIERIDTKWALTLHTRRGRHVAWAAPAPGRHSIGRLGADDLRHLPETAYVSGSVRASDLPRSDSGDAATIIRMRWEAMRASDAEAAPAEAQPVSVRLHVAEIAVLAALVLASLLSFLL